MTAKKYQVLWWMMVLSYAIMNLHLRKSLRRWLLPENDAMKDKCILLLNISMLGHTRRARWRHQLHCKDKSGGTMHCLSFWGISQSGISNCSLLTIVPQVKKTTSHHLATPNLQTWWYTCLLFANFAEIATNVEVKRLFHYGLICQRTVSLTTALGPLSTSCSSK